MKVTIELKEEAGITSHSLFNAKALTLAHGHVTQVLLYGDHQHCNYTTKVTYRDGYTFDFTGFSWGYGGEGPHGLMQFLHDSGFPGFDMQMIVQLPADCHGHQLI